MIDLQSKRILVTGGHGFLGVHLVDRLRQIGCRNILAPSRTECNLARAGAADQLFGEYKPEVVIHAAAAVGGIGANQNNPGLFFYVNMIMGVELIEAARKHGAEKIVVLGTICAYPKFTPVPFREEDLWNGYPEEVTAPYGIAKKALLVQCQTYRQQYGTNAIFLLPVNLYGPRDHFDTENSHVVPAIIRKCVDAKRRGEKELVLWGDGSATREFLYVEDAAAGIISATQCYESAEPVNLGSGVEISIRELAEEIVRQVGFNGRITWDTTRPNGQPRRCLDVSRAERGFGFRAQTTLSAGLRKTIDWYTGSYAAASG